MNKPKKFNKLPAPGRAEIHALSHDGRGIATIDEKKAFLWGGLPGEQVQYQITKKHRQYYDGDVVEVLRPSPERTIAPCKHYGVCGGCSLQHMRMEQQLAQKQQTLLEQLKAFGKVEPTNILPPLNCTTEGYRRKARLGVKYVIKKNKVLVGFREKASNYLADLEKCIVLHPKIGDYLSEFASLISTLTQYQHIPQIEVAVGDTEAALIFRHLQPLPDSDKQKLIAFGQTHQFQIYLQPNPPERTHKLWPADNIERLSYTLPDQGLEFLFHPLDFTQINLEMNRLMISQAIKHLELTPEDSVLDLFCGIGNFSLPIAKHCLEVVGIEGSQEMVERAQANAQHNCQKNTSFFVANLLSDLRDIPGEKKQFTKILLDPPRAGALEILPLIERLNAKRIVYVSCNPATFARDAGELVHGYNYHLQSVGIMNMFPHTSHIETMGIFVRME